MNIYLINQKNIDIVNNNTIKMLLLTIDKPVGVNYNQE